ncbi:EpsD family peptidyl-prolyl cis-trans isomerase [Undibacterium sp.]|uniref:EpsD family peptidyl-prolyl cis-trans isomerase n=1 Tax=Undibacterium sp. TaxID=1914977 RepID=UPI0025F7DC81|nr:EpsD family peptidyl-prolyl cis-trans isomerase [Undibacterium sp.]
MRTTIEMPAALTTATPGTRLLCSALIALAVLGLSACGNKEKAPGQAIAKVNGDEITVHQLNEELQRLGGQQGVTNKQVLEALVDRQLILGEALKEKTDRDPAVMQAVERAKAQIYVQAYLQKKIGNSAKPSKTDVDSFFEKNPDLFTQRKQYDLKELVIETKNFSPELSAMMDTAKSLDEVAAWLEAKNIQFSRAQISRTSTDLPAEMIKSLKGMQKGQLFTIKEGGRSLLVSLHEIKDAAVTAAVAAPQIEQFLISKKNKEASEAELARLRTTGKIEYLNAEIINKGQPADAAPASAVANPAANAVANPVVTGKPENKPDDAVINRGVAGLK